MRYQSYNATAKLKTLNEFILFKKQVSISMEIPQTHTADQPTEESQNSNYTSEDNLKKQPAFSSSSR